LLGQPGLSTH